MIVQGVFNWKMMRGFTKGTSEIQWESNEVQRERESLKERVI